MMRQKVQRGFAAVFLVALLMLADTLNLACCGRGEFGCLGGFILVYVAPEEPRKPGEPEKRDIHYGPDAILGWITHNTSIGGDGGGGGY